MDEEQDDLDEYLMRARWMMDGATTIEEMAQKLEQKAELLRHMDEEGWELKYDEVQNDYAHLIESETK